MELTDFHGQISDTATSSAYFWDSSHRGTLPFAIIQYTKSGRGFFRYRGEEYTVPADSAFISMIPEKSSYYFKETEAEPWTFSWITLDGHQAVRNWSEIRDEFGPVISFKDHPAILDTIEALTSASKSGELADPYRRSAEAYRFTMLALSVLKSGYISGSTIQREIDWLRAHPEHPAVVKELADRAGMSREHFTRLFIKEVSVSPAKFHKQLRIERAAELLLGTDRLIQDIALICGYSNVSRFSNSFKEAYGMGPRTFRAKNRHDNNT